MADANANPPLGLRWRSSSLFIVATVAIGMFTDLFLYGLVVPVLPFMLLDRRLGVPADRVQAHVSNLLAAYAGASVLASVPAGWVADRTRSRQAPFLSGLAALSAATVMFAVGRDLVVLYVARILQGVSAAVVWTIGLAMVMDTVGPDNLGKVIGSIFSFISIGELMAPVIGGILYEKTGYTGVFGLGAGILILDFAMRLLVIEKKTAAKYIVEETSEDEQTQGSDTVSGDDSDGDVERGSTEEDPLLLPKPNNKNKNKNKNKKKNNNSNNSDNDNENQDEDDGEDDEAYKIHGAPNTLVRNFPILVCFRSGRLVMSFVLAFVQACLLSVYDATIPTEARRLFGFTSLRAGLLFIALDVPYLLLGPVAGWAVDRYGTKPAAVFGFGWMVPALILLRIPAAAEESSLSSVLTTVGAAGNNNNTSNNVALYSALLALNGIGLAVIGAPSVVEASVIVRRFERANRNNPDFSFGPNGPYAQLYGFNSVFFCGGLTIGPVLAGLLTDSVGYGNMNLVFALLSGATAVLSFFIIGGRPAVLRRRRAGGVI